MEIEREFTIVNELGLHARAATKFVQVANRFDAEIQVVKKGTRVNGKSIMGVLMLVAGRGTVVTVEANGDDALEAVTALGNLIQNKFSEPT